MLCQNKRQREKERGLKRERERAAAVDVTKWQIRHSSSTITTFSYPESTCSEYWMSEEIMGYN